jgi:hypothetical protein
MTGVPNMDAPRTVRARRVVAMLVLAESIVVIGSGFVLALGILVARPTSRVGAGFLALLLLLLGCGVGAVGVAVWQGRRWARAPALVWQVLQLAVAAPALGARPLFVVALIGVPLVVLAVAVIVGVFVPGVIEAPPE